MKGFTQIKPKPEDEEDTEDMIVESDPIKRAEALLKKAFHTVKFASPTNNQVDLEADGETEKTPEFWDKISDGAMCRTTLFPADNWHGSIDQGEYHWHDYGIEGIPDNIAGGICEHGLMPLQSIKKPLGGNAKKAVWMAPVCNLAWMAGHVGGHKSKPLLKSKNRVIPVFLFPGDPRLKDFRLFWAPGAYVRAIHPARTLVRIPVQSSDTIEFDLDVIPYQFKYLPRHYDMVELMTPEQKRARILAKRKKYRKRDQLKRVEKRNIMMSKEGTITDLNKNDVLCGRGGRINSHVGNVQFRSIIQSKKSEYLVPNTPAGKALIVTGIVNTIRAQNPAAGRFLQLDKNTGLWFEIGDAQAYTKTGQGLREGAPARTAASHIVDSKKTTTTTTV